jgi:hypothetical protein
MIIYELLGATVVALLILVGIYHVLGFLEGCRKETLVGKDQAPNPGAGDQA